jgi:hypothetical protein
VLAIVMLLGAQRAISGFWHVSNVVLPLANSA